MMEIEKKNKTNLFSNIFLKGKFNLNGFGHVVGILLWSYGDFKIKAFFLYYFFFGKYYI